MILWFQIWGCFLRLGLIGKQLCDAWQVTRIHRGCYHITREIEKCEVVQDERYVVAASVIKLSRRQMCSRLSLSLILSFSHSLFLSPEVIFLFLLPLTVTAHLSNYLWISSPLTFPEKGVRLPHSVHSLDAVSVFLLSKMWADICKFYWYWCSHHRPLSVSEQPFRMGSWESSENGDDDIQGASSCWVRESENSVLIFVW